MLFSVVHSAIQGSDMSLQEIKRWLGGQGAAVQREAASPEAGGVPLVPKRQSEEA